MIPSSIGILELLVTNVGITISAVLTIGMGLFAFIKGHRSATNALFFLMCIPLAIFLASHVIGINLIDPELSRFAFLFHMLTPITFVASAHLIAVVTNRAKQARTIIIFFYTTSAALIALFLFNTNWFLLPSAPFLYFPNYYVPGALYPLQTLFEGIVLVYLSFILCRSYTEGDTVQKNRLWYFMAAYIFAYCVGLIPILPLYRIGIDPIMSALFGLWVIPIAYGILRQDLLDVKIVARSAFIYVVLVIASTAGLVAVNIANIILLQYYPNFPIWIVPAVSSLFGIGFGIWIWFKARESDVLKYEFINIISHKFRTPMTHIKLSLDELRTQNADEKMRAEAIERIELANNSLVELTEILMDTSRAADTSHFYHLHETDLNAFLIPLLASYSKELQKRNLTFLTNFAPELPPVAIDTDRIGSVLQILIDNAIRYSNDGGTIAISTEVKDKQIVTSIKDGGIGIKKEDVPRIFNQFFRTAKASSIDTEGLGISLFMARRIVERHAGALSARSEGENKGATLSMVLPALKLKK